MVRAMRIFCESCWKAGRRMVSNFWGWADSEESFSCSSTWQSAVKEWVAKLRMMMVHRLSVDNDRLFFVYTESDEERLRTHPIFLIPWTNWDKTVESFLARAPPTRHRWWCGTCQKMSLFHSQNTKVFNEVRVLSLNLEYSPIISSNVQESCCMRDSTSLHQVDHWLLWY